jgi:hypothetical protein
MTMISKIKQFSCIIPSALIMLACNENKTDNNVQEYVPLIRENIIPETISLKTFTNSDSIMVKGNKYSYVFKFTPSDSLPVITNSMNQKYYDNYVSLTISKNNRTVFNKKFTKNTFKSIIPSDFFKSSALVGFNFNYNNIDKHDAFYFIASVGDPDPSSEMNFPIDITISPDFNISYKEAIDMETQPISSGLTIDPGTDAGI